MKIRISKKTSYILIVIVALIMMGINMFILIDYRNSYDRYLQYQEEKFSNSVVDVFNTYERFSNYIFETQIDSEEMKDLLKTAYHSNEVYKETLRQDLFEIYDPIYHSLTEYNFRQLHFHLPDGESFLRLHYPDRHGDDLFMIRESVRIANEEERFVSGFEEGRIYNGYRYVYPLELEGVHVGTVEVSISAESVLEELYKRDEEQYVFFIIDKEVVDEKVLDEAKSNYRESALSDQYYEDKAVRLSVESHVDGVYEEVEFTNELKNTVEDILEETTNSFCIGMDYKDEMYLVQFSAIPNVANENVGYFVSIKPDEQLEVMQTINMRWIYFSVSSMVVTFLLMIFLIRKQSEVERLAMVDQLTKIYNRRFFVDVAEKEIRKSIRHESALCIAMIDIDHFKKVNDTYGHPEGDQVLKRIAKLVTETVREEDIFARYGGEEFVLLMPHTNALQAEVVSERVRKAVEQYPFPAVGHITVSIGICMVDVNKPLIENIDLADAALYEAKDHGRNQVRFNKV